MIDRPETPALLAAMAGALTDDVMPACDGAARHTARVVANLCMLLSREAGLPQGAAEAKATARTAAANALDCEPTPDAIERAIRALRDDQVVSPALLDALRADVAARLETARPGYATPPQAAPSQAAPSHASASQATSPEATSPEATSPEATSQ